MLLHYNYLDLSTDFDYKRPEIRHLPGRDILQTRTLILWRFLLAPGFISLTPQELLVSGSCDLGWVYFKLSRYFLGFDTEIASPWCKLCLVTKGIKNRPNLFLRIRKNKVSCSDLGVFNCSKDCEDSRPNHQLMIIRLAGWVATDVICRLLGVRKCIYYVTMQRHTVTTLCRHTPWQHCVDTRCDNTMKTHTVTTLCRHTLWQHHTDIHCDNTMPTYTVTTLWSHTLGQHYAETHCDNTMQTHTVTTLCRHSRSGCPGSSSLTVRTVSVGVGNTEHTLSELKSCVKVEMDVLTSPSPIVRTVSVGVQHWTCYTFRAQELCEMRGGRP